MRPTGAHLLEFDSRARPLAARRRRVADDGARDRRRGGRAGRTRRRPATSTGPSSESTSCSSARGRFRTRAERSQPLPRPGRAQGRGRRAGQGAARSTSSSASTTIATTRPRTTSSPRRRARPTASRPSSRCSTRAIGIRHGSITTLHDMTNTQTVVDAPHKDLRRARAASLSLIPTTTGSATAIGLIFPELEGRLERPRGARAAAQRVAHRLRVRGGARRRRVEEVNGLLARCGRGPARRHPRLRGAAARVRRLQGRPSLGDRRRASRRWSWTAPR